MSARKNFLYNLGYTLLNLALPLLTMPYISRIVGVTGVGVYSYVYAISHYFVLIAKLGLTNYGTRNIAIVRGDRKKLDYIFSGIFYQQLFFGVLATIVYSIFVASIIGSEYRMVSYIMILTVVSTIFDIDWVYSGLERFKNIAIRNTVAKVLSVLLIFVFVKNENDLWLYASIMSMGTLFGFLSMWLNLNKYVRFVKVSIDDVLKHIKPNMILAIPVLSVSIYRSVDKIMLGWLASIEQVGLYENAEKLIYSLCGFIIAFGTVMMPKMTKMVSSGDNHQLVKTIKKSMKLMMCLVTPLAFGLAAIASRIIPILFGMDFLGSVELLVPLSITIIFIGWANVIRTQYIIPNNFDRVYIYSTLVGAVINIIINYMSIPTFGAYGAVVGTFFAELIVCIIQSYSVRCKLPFGEFVKDSIPYWIFGLFMYMVVVTIGTLVGHSVGAMVFLIFIGGIVYTVMTTVYLRFYDKELLLFILKPILKKNKG